MEKNFYTDDQFERLLREQTEKFTMQPTKRVWHSVYNDLHPARKWPSIAISLLLVVSILLLGYFNTGNGSDATVADNAKKTDKGTIAVQSGVAINTAREVDITPATTSGTETTTAANIGTQPASTTTSQISTVPQSSTTPTNVVRNGRTSSRSFAPAYTTTTTVTGNLTAATGNADNTIGNNSQQPAVNNPTKTDLFAKANSPVNANPQSTIAATTVTTTVPAIISNPAAETTITPASGNSTTSEKSIGADDNLQESGIVKPVADFATRQTDIAGTEKVKNSLSAKNSLATTDDKAWMDDHAFYNKVRRGKWKNKLSWQVYATPSVSYRMLFDNTKSGENGSLVPNGPAMLLLRDKSIENSVTHKPGPGMEVGAAVVYAASKRLRVKLGTQLNYNSYQMFANEIAHPFGTTILLNNINTGNLDIESHSTSISNIPGGRKDRMTSYSYQLALPVGFDYKIRGNNVINWYAGISLQPSFVLSSTSYLLSADRLAYVNAKQNDKSLMRNFNLAFGAETFVSYKRGDYTFMAGPKLRYQLLTTNSKVYTVGERAYNIGLSLGLQKNF
jgi:hypothetical protein